MPASGLAIGCRAFRLPRRDCALDECQDAAAANLAAGRFAVADGASESAHCALWARLLVEEFVRRGERQPAWVVWLPAVQQRWTVEVGRAPDTPPLPWYLEPGLLQGAFATFLGLVVEEKGWYAQAVGDSCLFQVRDGGLLRAFPITRAADFTNSPWLLGSRASPAELLRTSGCELQGEWRPGDRLWLMTDALAQWFLAQVEAGGKPWLALDPLIHAAADDSAAEQAFAAWVEGLRAARQLRNDDVTLMAVNV